MNQNSSYKVAVIDVDGTLIAGQIQQGIINFLYKKGELNLWSIIMINFWFIFYKLRLTSDIKRVFEYGLQYLKNKPIEQVDSIVTEYIEKVIKQKIYPKSFELINTLRDEGYTLVILSTAIDAVISRISELFKIDNYICTLLETKGGLYTGKINGKIIYGDTKTETLSQYFKSKGYSLREAVAYADHESDIPMLKMVGKAYVVNPDAYMRSVAQKEGIGIMDTK